MWILVCQVVSFCGIPLGQCRVRSVTLALRGGSSTPLGSHTDAVHWFPGFKLGEISISGEEELSCCPLCADRYVCAAVPLTFGKIIFSFLSYSMSFAFLFQIEGEISYN